MTKYYKPSFGSNDYFLVYKDEKKFSEKKSILEAYKYFSRNK